MAAPGNGLIPIEVFVTKHQDMGLEAFTTRYKEPFVLILSDKFDPNDSRSYNTIGMAEPFVDPSGTPMCLIAPLSKSAGNPFTMVTVGRTKNNDITIEHKRISKVHCFFKSKENGQTTVTDSGSKNGTEVNGLPIKEKEAFILESGDTIVLAELVSMTFLSAEGLYKRVLNFK